MSLPGCASYPPPPPQPHTLVRLTTGPPGGGFFPLGEGLARAYGRLLPDVTVEVHASSGAVANVEAIQRGDADLGFAFADVTYLAFVGRLNGASGSYDRLRGVAVLQLTPVHLVVRQDLGLKELRDLRGRRVGVGPPGSGTALTAELILGAFGISPSDIHVEMLQFNEAARRLVGGTLDAMFDDAIYPAESVRMAARTGARLLPLTGRPLERLRHDYPFFRAAVIPRDAYPGVTEAVHTIGVDSLLVCRRDLDEALVHDLTTRFFEALPSLPSSQDALRFMDLDQAPATPIPLHEGAARYYRERELLR
jgi:hypothetical protein